jgi:hypothetical protein
VFGGKAAGKAVMDSLIAINEATHPFGWVLVGIAATLIVGGLAVVAWAVVAPPVATWLGNPWGNLR